MPPKTMKKLPSMKSNSFIGQKTTISRTPQNDEDYPSTKADGKSSVPTFIY